LRDLASSFGRVCASIGLALAVAGTAGPAAASEYWIGTATHAHDVRGTKHLGAMAASQRIKVTVALKLRDKAGLDQLTAQLVARKPGVQPLTRAQWLARHAPTEAQARTVVEHLRSHGFTDIEVTPDRLLVNAVGGASAVQEAFKAEIHEYDVGGRRAYANTTDAMIPAYLGDTVLSVLGLQTVHVFQGRPATRATRPAVRATAAVARASTQAVGGCPGGSVICIDQFPAIYGASAMPSATNATIGIITVDTQANLNQTIADLKSFAQYAGYPVPSVSIANVSTYGPDYLYGDEWNMDTQSALAAAGGTVKSIVLYNAANNGNGDLTNVFRKAMSDGQAKVVSASIALCEETFVADGSMAADDAIFESAVALNQTFVFASGDMGEYHCTNKNWTPILDYPAASPYVMAIGGTTLTTANGNTWVAEDIWTCYDYYSCRGQNDPGLAATGSGGSGGGFSVFEKAPRWQIAAGVIGRSANTAFPVQDPGRGVPDLAFDGNLDTGAWVLYKGAWTATGGTSLAAPLFAGFYARIQSAHGNTLPFPAQILYAGGKSHPEWFHRVPASSTGWNPGGGFGSLQVQNFSKAFDFSPAALIPIFDELLLGD
jgi:pseudomonalisin/xanthomonalisin